MKPAKYTKLFGTTSTLAALLSLALLPGTALSEGPDGLTDKTLVVWAAPANLTQHGGSALTINDTTIDRFDGVVLGELNPAVWMAGSNTYSRTCKEQAAWPKETAGPNEFVQMAIVYQGKKVTIYRNGQLYAQYTMEGEPYTFTAQSELLIGPRHINNPDCFVGRIKDARIYDRALDAAAVAALKPNAPSTITPWAWLDFSRGLYDRSGRFGVMELRGKASIEDGCLVLADDHSGLVAKSKADNGNADLPTRWTKDDPTVPAAAIQSARLLREKMLADPYRPGYHFCIPEDNAMPGDSNGCFYANGRYHLMYLYNRNGMGFSWGHLSSKDLVHWRNHPDSIMPGDGDVGCFSGGAFVDDDGTAYLSYWMLDGARGIGLAKSHDRHYSHWTKFPNNPVIKSTEWGITETVDANGNKLVYGSADPSNIWKKDGKYYMVAGNLLVLNKYGRAADSPRNMKGDHLYLFESANLKDWKYKGEFYERNPAWTDASEDNMCPSFLPLPRTENGGDPSDKYLLMFLSHNRGAHYYIGDYDKKNDKFIPTSHGRMSWNSPAYFAPEAMIDGQGRQIAWVWLHDTAMENETQRYGWSGVYGLPRSLWLGQDGTLCMAPVKELSLLRQDEKTWKNLSLASGATKKLDLPCGDSCELEITVDPGTAERVGVKVMASADGKEETVIYYDARTKQLVADASRSGIYGRRMLEAAPFELPKGQPLKLRVFVDKSVVEVYANDRQAICQRVFPASRQSTGVVLFAEGGKADFPSVRAWEMMPANPY